MPARTVVLNDLQQQFEDARAQSGSHQNASAVVRDGLLLIEARERFDRARFIALKQAVRRGWADVSAGRYVDLTDEQLEDFVGQLGRRAAQRSASPR